MRITLDVEVAPARAPWAEGPLAALEDTDVESLSLVQRRKRNHLN